eukprot:RCo036565
MNQSQPKTTAEIYEAYFVPAMFQPWATILLRHANLHAGQKVLDVACGTGIVARQAAPLVGESGQIIALDINPAMLAVARELASPEGAAIQWQEGNILALPFQAHSFDAVLCQHGLQFIPDREGALREMRRVLTPEGQLVVVVLQSLSRHPVFEALMNSVARHLSLPLASVKIPFALDDPQALKSLINAAGFTQVDIETESTTVRFAEPERFVPLAVASSAAAVPAFAQLHELARAELFDAVRADVEPVLCHYRDAKTVTFPMFAYVIVAKP